MSSRRMFRVLGNIALRAVFKLNNDSYEVCYKMGLYGR